MFETFTNLSWSRPTPQTRMLLIGWEWSRLRSSGSTRFNIRSWSTNSIPLPWTTNKHKQGLCTKPNWNRNNMILISMCHNLSGPWKLKVKQFEEESLLIVLNSSGSARIESLRWAEILPLPRLRLSLVCLSCSRTAVWYSGGRPRCSSPHTGPVLPSPSSPEISLEMTGIKTLLIRTHNVPLTLYPHLTSVITQYSLFNLNQFL